MRWLKRGFRRWRQGQTNLTPRQVQAEYEGGFAGAWLDTESKAMLHDSIRSDGGEVCGSDLATSLGFADSGAGKLSLPFLYAAIWFPGCYPGPAQERGDCVSHGGAGASLTTIARDIAYRVPDEQTGVVEGVPDMPTQGITEGVTSSEWLYWHRGYNGDGWDCASVARVILKDGVLLKQPYPELGIDLTNYSGSLAGKYGRQSPPEKMNTEGRKHLIRTATELDTMEATRDWIHQGYGVIDCGSQGWSSSRDENGVSVQRGRWAHSMIEPGFDDRDIVKQKYGEPLLLIKNSWGVWNRGPRDVMDSARYVPPALKQRWIELDIVNAATGNIMIPLGSFWTKWSSAANRYRIALSGANGWAPRPDGGDLAI